MEPDSWLGSRAAALRRAAGESPRPARSDGPPSASATPSRRSASRSRRSSGSSARSSSSGPGGPRPVSLTEAGQLLLRHADSIVARLQAAQADLQALRAGEAGTLRVGTFQSAGARVLPEIMRRFTAQWPLIEVMLEEHDDEEIADALERGELDVGFVLLPIGDAPLETVELLRDPYVLVVAAGSPLADGPPSLQRDRPAAARRVPLRPLDRPDRGGVPRRAPRAALGVPVERQPDRAGAGRRRDGLRDRAAADRRHGRSRGSSPSTSEARSSRASSGSAATATATRRRRPARSSTRRSRPEPPVASYSTVTVFARFRGWSTFRPRSRAMR